MSTKIERWLELLYDFSIMTFVVGIAGTVVSIFLLVSQLIQPFLSVGLNDTLLDVCVGFSGVAFVGGGAFVGLALMLHDHKFCYP
jgi:hypothetical protein